MKKFLTLFLIILLCQITKAQNEFITIWKPALSTIPPVNVDAPVQATPNQIWFPGIGINYKIVWEEVGYPQHTGTMNNVTSVNQVLIDFGASLNPDPAEATYRVKVSNGNGQFQQMQFNSPNQMSGNIIVTWFTLGSADKITAIEQWGNIQWTSMSSAFSSCSKLQLTATDLPNLSNVQDMSYMFRHASNFTGNASMKDWNTSGIKNMKGTFLEAEAFNQPLDEWDTGNVTDMSDMFAYALAFNQPLNNWNTSKVTNMSAMFHFIPNFNQPINNWDTSQVTSMAHMLHGCTSFNQPLNNWDTSNVTDANIMLSLATSFNQSLETWNLPSLTTALLMLTQSGMDCTNYSNTLKGWANNPNTANSINLGPIAPFTYSTDVINERNILLSKGWILDGDVVGECRILGSLETELKDQPSIYPNPATDFIYLKNIQGIKSYIILDMSGRIIMRDSLSKDYINIQALTSGNYILQLTSKDNILSFKFIKK
jgi:surface protein